MCFTQDRHFRDTKKILYVQTILQLTFQESYL